ncbi:TECTA protein, partial [Regulus satrapa]|nr:TECTA protein [Regulus satrapa]
PTGSLLYPDGQDQGDETIPKHDDGTFREISLSIPFTFYGKSYQTVFVNNNGVISFNEPIRPYTPDPLLLMDGRPFVAPYWADVDTILGGDIFYHQTINPALLEDISQDITQNFPKSPFTATWAWWPTTRMAPLLKRLGPWGMKGNTFQAVLTTDSKVFYIIPNYWDIQWTTGAASDEDPEMGLGGTPAHAGFNSGNETNFYNIPGCQTDAIINITTTSNVKVP